MPDVNETLRINGTARITDDARLLAPGAMQNHAHKVGLIVTVEEAFLHCAKALVRSDLWNAQKHIDRAILPNYPAMLLNHVRGWAVPTARISDLQACRWYAPRTRSCAGKAPLPFHPT